MNIKNMLIALVAIGLVSVGGGCLENPYKRIEFFYPQNLKRD